MDPQQMLQVAALLLVCTAAGGIVLAGFRFLGRSIPNWLTMAHGVLAASAITLLLYLAFMAGAPQLALIGIGFLIIAVTGGLILNLRYHLRGVTLPVWLIGLHVSMAVIGTMLVLTSVFTSAS